MRFITPGPGAIIGPQITPDPNADITFAAAAQVAAELATRTQAVTATATQFGNLAGSEKFIGGGLTESGGILLTPYGNSKLGSIAAGALTEITNQIGTNSANAYQTACLAHNGLMFFAPASAGDVLIYDTRNGTAFKLGVATIAALAYSQAIYHPVTRLVYLIPFNASNVMIIDPDTLQVTTTNYSLANMTDTAKWSGGVLGLDGKIYGVPRTSTTILIIDAEAGTATRSNLGATLTGSNKWVGGCNGPDGRIYCAPLNSTDMLVINTAAGTASRELFGTASLNTGSGATTGKWRGIKCGLNGRLYCVPASANRVLEVDTVANTVAFLDFGLTVTGYQGAIQGADGAIYMVPFSSTNVLRIATGTPSVASARSALSPFCNG